MGSYALMTVLPLLQVVAIAIVVKKLRGSRALVFGVIAVGCWMLSGIVSIFLRSATSADMVTTGIILSLLSFGGWISFIVMLLTLPVEDASGSARSAASVLSESSTETQSPGPKPDLVYRFGRIGALAGFIVYLFIAGIDRLSDGDILAGAGWGFVSGFLGGGAGAVLGLLLEKLRS